MLSEIRHVGIFRLPMLPRRRGLVWSAVLFLVFALLFVPVYAVMQTAAGLFALLPVITAAWTLGWVGGAIAGGIAVALMSVIGVATGEIHASALAEPSVILRSAALILVGGGVGRLRELLSQSVDAIEARQREVVARKQAEAAAREAEAKYRILVEHSLAGVYIIQDDRFVYANPKLCEIYGYTREELMALPTYLEIAAEEDRPRVAESVRRRLSGEEDSAHYLVRARRKGGAIIHLEIHGGRTDYQGRPAVVGTVLDVTERQRSEDALRESEERFRQVFEESPLGMALVDRTFHIVKANRALASMLEYDESELVGLRFTEITHPADRDVDLQLSREVFEGRRSSFSLEKRYLKKSGDIVFAYLTATMLRDSGGQPRYGLGMVADITPRKSMEERLLRAQRLESIGQLAGGVAHNFNNALTAIFGYSELALHHLADDHPGRPDIERIQHVAEQSAAMTRQLLAFSRRQTVASSRFDLNAAVEAAEALFRPLVGERVQLLVRLRPGVGLVSADRGQIEQVVTNLVLNARDAMPDGGTVTVDTASLAVDADFARAHPEAHVGTYARLTVTDTGVGMDAATRARIFDPFFTTKAPGRGVGLGLAMVHGAVTQSGGFITVRSRPGQGTSFAVYLPCTTEDEPASSGGLRPDATGEGGA